MVFNFFDEPRRSAPKFSQKEIEPLYTAQKGKCNGCGVKFPMRNMTVDHIKPKSRGGTERFTNLQLLCGACNSMKGNGTQGELMKRLRAKGIIKTPAKPAAKSKTTKSKTTKPKTTARRRAPARSQNPFDIF